MQLLTVIVARCFVDLAPDLLDAAIDPLAITAAPDDSRIVLVYDHSLGMAELLDCQMLEGKPQLVGYQLGAGQFSDVLQHRLPAVTETWRLDRTGFQRSADLINDQRSQRLALDVLSHHQQRPAGFRHLLKQWNQVFERGDLATASIFSGLVMK